MASPQNDNLQINAGKAVDNKLGKIQTGKTVPYASVSEANAAILSAYRYVGLEVLVTISGETVKHWYKAGTTDSDLIPYEEFFLGNTFSGDGRTSGTAINVADGAITQVKLGPGVGVVKQVHASGTTVTISNATTWLVVDGGSTFASLSVLLPATPTDLQEVVISADDDITTFSVVPNSGHTLNQATAPSTMQAGESVTYRFTNTKWYRIN